MPLDADSLGGMGRRFARFLHPTYCSRQSLVATAFLTVTASAIVRVYPRAAAERVAAEATPPSTPLPLHGHGARHRQRAVLGRLAVRVQCRGGRLPQAPATRAVRHREDRASQCRARFVPVTLSGSPKKTRCMDRRSPDSNTGANKHGLK